MHLVAGFKLYPITTQSLPQTKHPKGKLERHQSPTKVNFVPYGQPLHNSSSTVVAASFHNQSAWESFPPIEMQIDTKGQLEQDGTHNTQNGHT